MDYCVLETVYMGMVGDGNIFGFVVVHDVAVEI